MMTQCRPGEEAPLLLLLLLLQMPILNPNLCRKKPQSEQHNLGEKEIPFLPPVQLFGQKLLLLLLSDVSEMLGYGVLTQQQKLGQIKTQAADGGCLLRRWKKGCSCVVQVWAFITKRTIALMFNNSN